jgi:hypothetical protein
MPVAKAIELLGIEREDMQAPVEQGIDDGAAGRFDGHRDPAGLRRSQRRELIGQGGESYAGVRDATRGPAHTPRASRFPNPHPRRTGIPTRT